MKKIFTILLGSILFLSLASCSSNVDNITTSTTTTIQEEKNELKYRFYTLEDGVTDLSFLEGYPWLNTSIEGVMGKIKKPSAKDDFGPKINQWMAKIVVKASQGLVDLSMATASNVLATLICKYYGWS